MHSLETKIRGVVAEYGGDLAGITSRTRMSDGPPSADPTYVLPGAEGVISFAAALDQRIMRRFIAKRAWREHCDERREIVRRLYRIGDALVELLVGEGYDAVNVDINNNYRPEPGAADVTEQTEFHPIFSHRYAAVAAGVGRLGWSGNVMTPTYGSLVELGSVVTTAVLAVDDPISDDAHPCDRCKACATVCPVGMISSRETVEVAVGGVTDQIAAKRPNTCCWIGCTAYDGASVSRTWSNWSPYRLGFPLPDEKAKLDSLCVSLQKADPQMKDASNAFANFRGAVHDPAWFYHTVCGFCRGVCWPERSDRIENRKIVHTSGTAALTANGEHVVASEEAVEVLTPYGVRVVAEPSSIGRSVAQDAEQVFPLDREVAHFLRGLDPRSNG